MIKIEEINSIILEEFYVNMFIDVFNERIKNYYCIDLLDVVNILKILIPKIIDYLDDEEFKMMFVGWTKNINFENDFILEFTSYGENYFRFNLPNYKSLK